MKLQISVSGTHLCFFLALFWQIILIKLSKKVGKPSKTLKISETLRHYSVKNEKIQCEQWVIFR